MPQSRFALAACLVLLGTVTRVLPYVLYALGVADISDPNLLPWNVSPMGAIALFGGACFSDRRTGFAVILASLFLGDLGMALLMKDLSFGFPVLAPVTYGCFLLMGVLGRWLHAWLQQQSGALSRVLAIGGTALAGEIVFFVISNFANWVFQGSYTPDQPPLYPHTPAGLLACYIAAIPFFGKSLTGMLVYATALFGGYALLQKRAEAPQRANLAQAH
ncbi:MAG TPA: DUF6580 family putative transport protein [Planctomycetaceae bacterium]|nr:DUF6580 family putative transport protein [Planctomycetaceae bacterium]